MCQILVGNHTCCRSVRVNVEELKRSYKLCRELIISASISSYSYGAFYCQGQDVMSDNDTTRSPRPYKTWRFTSHEQDDLSSCDEDAEEAREISEVYKAQKLRESTTNTDSTQHNKLVSYFSAAFKGGMCLSSTRAARLNFTGYDMI